MTSNTTHPMSDAEALAAVLAEDANERAGEQPQLEELADYLAGDLSPEREAQIQSHLVSNRTAATQLLDLETLAEPEPQPAEGVADLAVAAGWREQKSRIADMETARRRQNTLRWVSAVAASFFVATLGLSVHVTQLRQKVAELQTPTANEPVVYFDAYAIRSDTEPVTVKLGPKDRSLLFILTPTGPKWPDYEVQVLSASGAEVSSAGGLMPSEMGTLRLRMPRAILDAGDYEVRLFGHDGERRVQVQATTLLVRDK